MKKSRFNKDQMVRILRDADAEPVPKLTKRHGVSEQTIYSWSKRYGVLKVVDVRRPCELTAENARLKRMLAQRDLEFDVMKNIGKIVVSIAIRRQQVEHTKHCGLDQHGASHLLSVDRKALSCEWRLAKRDSTVLHAIHELARQ